MKNFQIPSTDGVHELHVAVWEPVTEVKAVLQISHGMIEFIERYDGFAQYLNQRGILVVGNDHLGHGQTAGCDEDLGYFCPKDMSKTVVNDLHKVTLAMKQKYPGVPYFLLGHSMGSFMARRYIMTYGKELNGAVICGTGCQPGAVLVVAKVLSNMIRFIKSDRYRSALIKKISFGAYNRKIKPLRTENDWLTKDTEIVDWYNANKYCTFNFTVNGYRGLFDVLTFIQTKKNVKKIPSRLPLFFIAGGQDPVGNYGKGVKKVYEYYKKLGVRDISCKIYKDDRHEILNELDKLTVYEDVAKWLEGHISNR